MENLNEQDELQEKIDINVPTILNIPNEGEIIEETTIRDIAGALLSRKTSPTLLRVGKSLADNKDRLNKSFFWNIIEKIDSAWRAFNTKNDEDKEYVLKTVLHLPDVVVEYQQFWNERNRIMSALFYVFIVFYGMINSIVIELLHYKTTQAQELNSRLPISIPNPEMIMNAKVRHDFDFSIAETMLAKLGLDDSAKQVYLDAIKQVAPIPTLYENLWREKITPDEFMHQLARLGYDVDQQPLFANLSERIPPIQDIIRFAVKEAFSDELSTKFSHDEDFPEDFAKYSAMQGYDREWSERYWRAHWQIPSPLQGYQFLHRRALKRDGNIFDKDDLNDMLKMADYAPEYRNLLEQVSYRVLSRVDVRRIYKLGVWSNLPDMTAEEKVYETYLDQGYKPKDAEIMTKFTVQYTLDAKRRMVQTELKNLYKKGLVTSDYLREKMEDLGFLDEDITYIILEGDYELQQETTEKFLKYAKSMYFNGRWTQATVIMELGKAGLPVIDNDRLFEIWGYEKKAVRRIPTKSDVLDWLEKDLFELPPEAEHYLVELGYSPEVAKLYVDAKLKDMGGI